MYILIPTGAREPFPIPFREVKYLWSNCQSGCLATHTLLEETFCCANYIGELLGREHRNRVLAAIRGGDLGCEHESVR